MHPSPLLTTSRNFQILRHFIILSVAYDDLPKSVVHAKTSWQGLFFVCLFGIRAECVEDEEAGQISRTLKKYQHL